MKTYDDYVAEVFAHALKYGPEDFSIISDLTNQGSDKIFRGNWFTIFKLLVSYFRLTGKVITKEAFVDLIQGLSAQRMPAELRQDLTRLFVDALSREVPSGTFRFSMHQLKSCVMTENSMTMLTNAHQALIGNVKIGKVTYSGYAGMKQILMNGLFDSDRIVTDYSPEGNINEETKDIITETSLLKDRSNIVTTGYSSIDSNTGGLYPGELWLIAGYAGEGKTMLCTNIGHNVAFVQRKNVVFFTSETVRNVVRRRLVTRHARWLYSVGIDLTAWKKGMLTPESLTLLKNTVEDMGKWKEKGYGIFHLAQLPANATTDYIATALSRLQAMFNVDLVVLDSIHLLNPKRARQNQHSELDDMLIDSKRIAVTHNNGKGVPFISPWHVNRASWEKAKAEGVYNKASLAKSAEAERQADVIAWLLRRSPSDLEIRGGLAKVRDGEEVDEFYFSYDFRTAYIADNQAVMDSQITLMEGFKL